MVRPNDETTPSYTVVEAMSYSNVAERMQPIFVYI